MNNRADITGKRRSHAQLAQRAFPSRRTLLAVALIALAVVASFTLAGCKYSDVLTQHTEDPELGELDENEEPTYKSNPDAEQTLDLAELTITDSETVDTQVEKLPHYDPDAPDNGPTKQRIKSTETPHDEEASEGSEEGEADREGSGEGDEGGEPNANSSGPDDGPGEESTSTSDTLDDPEGEPQDPTSGGPGGNPLPDPNGPTDPEDPHGTIAAVGEYATIVQMVGGEGALVAADETWLADAREKGLFSSGGDELGSVEIGFTGDGSAAGSCQVQTIIDSGASIVLHDETDNLPALSDEDRASLEAAGIVVKDVYHIGEQDTEDYTVTQAVLSVAQMLTQVDALGISDPVAMASTYVSGHDTVLTQACRDNDGYSYKVVGGGKSQLYQDNPLAGLSANESDRTVTAFVADLGTPESTVQVTRWTGSSTDKVAIESTRDASDGVGVSAQGTGSYMLVDYYIQLAGLVNNAYAEAKPAKRAQYTITPGNVDGYGTYESRGDGSSSALHYMINDNYKILGDAEIPVVLVASDDIKEAIVKSAAKTNGENPGVYNVGKSYRIAVVPSGLAGSWAEGHIDSCLLALWAYYAKTGKSSDLSTAESYMSEFYENYLRCADWTKVVQDVDNVGTGQ